MAAYDNVAMPGAPAAPSYAAPLLDFSPVSQLGQSYFQGTQNARTLRLQNAFQDGLPKNADGSLNVNSMVDTLAKLGGADAAGNMLPLLIQQQIGAGNAAAITGNPGGNPGTVPSGSPQPVASASVPASRPSVAPPHGVPAVPSAQDDTISNIVQSQINDPNVAGRVITALSARMRLDPDAKVNPNDPTVRSYIDSATRGGVIPTGGTAGNPPPRPVMAQAAPNVPTGFDMATAGRYEQAAQALRARAAQIGKMDPQGASALEKQADAYDARAKAIVDYNSKYNEVTTEQKNAASSGFPSPFAFETAQKEAATRQKNLELTPEQKNAASSGNPNPLDYEGLKEVNKQDVDRFNKRDQGIQALGEASFNGIEKAKLMKNLTLDPNFYSGPLHEGVQTYNQFKSIFGSNPTSALPQEAFNKVVNDMLTEQVKSMGQSGVGRVLQTEVNTMKQAISSLGITPSSNRALAEIVQRVYKQNQDIAEISRSIPQKPGQMNRALDQRITQYLQQHPLFTEQERQDPRILGAPDAPPQAAKWTPQQARAWGATIGLKPGDPVRFGGQVGVIP